MKLANLAHARAVHPAIRQTDTPMIAINEAMGFRPQDRLVEFQLEL